MTIQQMHVNRAWKRYCKAARKAEKWPNKKNIGRAKKMASRYSKTVICLADHLYKHLRAVQPPDQTPSGGVFIPGGDALPCQHSFIQKDTYWKSCTHCGMIAPLGQ